jgi:2-dehydro-3-deoxyphosphogalactonate aldolase
VPVFAVGGVTPENLAQWIKQAVPVPGWAAISIALAKSVERTQRQAAFVKAYREAVQ